jgi:hypothetical protein
LHDLVFDHQFPQLMFDREGRSNLELAPKSKRIHLVYLLGASSLLQRRRRAMESGLRLMAGIAAIPIRHSDASIMSRSPVTSQKEDRD